MDRERPNRIDGLLDALKAFQIEEQPRSDGLRAAWRDDGVLWTIRWAEALGRDLANAEAALTRAEEIGADDAGAAEVENALWRVDAAFEKFHDVVALGLGVPALRVNPDRRGIRRFESDRRENRRRLRELADVHGPACDLLRLDERVNNHRFLALRHQMTHSLAPLLSWQSLCWFEVGEIDDRGGVIGYSSHHLTPQDTLQTSLQPDELFPRAVADGREIIDLLAEAINQVAVLLRETRVLPPPPLLWRVMSTGELFFDRAEASDAARAAAGDAESGHAR